MTNERSVTTSDDGSSLPNSNLEVTLETTVTKEISELRARNDSIELVTLYAELQSPRQSFADNLDMGLEIIDPGRTTLAPIHSSTSFNSQAMPPPPPIPVPVPVQFSTSTTRTSEGCSRPGRTFPLSTFYKELGALLVMFILCMILVLAIREDQDDLRVTMQVRLEVLHLNDRLTICFEDCVHLHLSRFHRLDDLVCHRYH